MQAQLTHAIMAAPPPWGGQPRRYAGRGRSPQVTHLGGLRLRDPAGKVDVSVHLLLDESGPTPTTYQVPLTARSHRLAGGDHALVATAEPDGHDTPGTVYLYDAPHDPAFASALLAKAGSCGPRSLTQTG